MTAVLLHSNKVGSTGWICLRRGNSLRVSGMEDGDMLGMAFKPQRKGLFVDEDGCFPLPSEAEHVQVTHIKVAERANGGGVDIDLVRMKV